MAANPHAYSAVPAARDDANATPQDVWPTEVAGTGRRKLAVCAGLLAGWLGVVGLVRSNVDGAASGASVGKALAGTQMAAVRISAASTIDEAEAFRTVRVTKGQGSRGYDSLRISVVTTSTSGDDSVGTAGAASDASAAGDASAASDASDAVEGMRRVESGDASPWVASYSSGFLWRWTQLHLESGLVNMTSDDADETVSRTFDLGEGEAVEVSLPAQGKGVRGVILADPCIDSSYVTCKYASVFETKERTPALLEALVGDERNGVSFWGILGDNLYDQVSPGSRY